MDWESLSAGVFILAYLLVFLRSERQRRREREERLKTLRNEISRLEGEATKLLGGLNRGDASGAR